MYLAILRNLGTHTTMSPTSYDVVTGKGYWIPIVPETRRGRPRPQPPQGSQPTETSTTEMITEVITESVTEVNMESVTEVNTESVTEVIMESVTEVNTESVTESSSISTTEKTTEETMEQMSKGSMTDTDTEPDSELTMMMQN